MAKYTKKYLEKLATESYSMAELMRKAGISTISGGMHSHLKKRIKQFGIDISHWTGRQWNKGKILPVKNPDEILVERKGSYKEHTLTLLKAILQSGIEYKCNNCGLSEWIGKFIRLHVEHKNGDNMDNRIENLELLCPNCHSQTPTYGVLKRNRGCGGVGRRDGLSYGSLTEKLVRSMLLNSANAEMPTPSQASKEEGVETRQERPKARRAKAKA